MFLTPNTPNSSFGDLLTHWIALCISGLVLKTTGSPNYRDILKRVFASRAARNGSYSLRAFARDIGLSPASLSLVLNQEQGLSRVSAQRIGERLGLSEGERELLCDLVESEHARGRKQRELAQIRLRKHDIAGTTLQLEVFQVMSDWYHFAILELTMVQGFESSAKWIGQALGIGEKVAALAIERLLKLEMLEEVDGILRQTTGFLATPSGIPSDALKKFHQQILRKAEEALYCQSVDERDFAAVVFPLRSADLPWAKQRLKEFRREIMARLEAAPDKDQIYCFSTQLFGLQHKPQPKKLSKMKVKEQRK